ncbi:malate dehydrogenase (quinone) [Acinetobacter bereziniae]|jgi:malate dehydrogenase (quinone)|uniref:Probable malate:quinone oxidoreductase n=1 Tax=Acinetobacter bereziniae LMG 1003 = CIP 70.12 TaxID=981324 RepID=N9F6E3_ACIBZ|nr:MULTISPECIES: malate dehydrogenase (quinone) [Acinetobacter]ATZ63512.1 malate:quinone oxidoreductase [Acinetobacter bereziniae]ELW79145.1 malate dehydrogenase (quinone) [Acinetobacter sp. WC-743]ENW00414.1 malate dehydrogenase (acceptor) [Acinetobacter bereziniae LMG 1003 = CIP 70.12]KKW80920.1 malate:quinone oxidoreductase [Acinetobacter sp. Ag2]MBJ8422788.1 malate dehydrogenase (quinone) [Acinetobacter bereziniae]
MKRFFKYLLIVIGVVFVIGLIFLFRPISSKKVTTAADEPVVDVVLVGGGIMSATLGTYLNEVEPDWTVQMYERLDQVGQESSAGFNNAGTGHSGFMEMNYTPEKDGKVDIKKAIDTASQFEVSKQFWSYQVKNGVLGQPSSFINPVPHIAFVWGDSVNYMKKRYDAMRQSPMFEGLKYTENPDEIKQWAPLVMQGRDANQKVAATRMDVGSDVNYGSITTQLVDHLKKQPNFKLETSTEVTGISQNEDKTWTVSFKNLKTNQASHVKTRHVFIGAGGAAIRLLQMTGLEETKQYAGFPIGGIFLMTDNPAVTAQHTAKVYGKPELGAPPMSVPHIDTRYVDGKKYVLFGPFATYSNKFLKNGSQFDLIDATNKNNVIPMATIGVENLDLVKYLVSQVAMSKQDQFNELKKYYPDAKIEDWNLSQAGQRVQIIKKAPGKPATLQFGTEIFSSKDGSITALLGASPGASTSPYIMLSLMEKAFPEQVKGKWNPKLHEIVKSYQQDLNSNPALLDQVRTYTSATLGLNYTPTRKAANDATTATPAVANAH